VSLLPLTPTADGISTTGLAYPLNDATLYFERSRGVSNVVTQMPATVHVKSGILLVVQHAHPVE
jgi:thiamine pyrophosphokinase